MSVLEPVGAAVSGWFSAQRPPAVTVEPGATVSLRTLDCWWSAGPFGGPPPERPRVPEYVEGAGHALTGPIAVRGARPGGTLAVGIHRVVPDRWGTTVAGGWSSPHTNRFDLVDDGAVHVWELDPEAAVGRNSLGLTVALRPFLGVIGMPPPEPGEHSTIPPRAYGGNLDCRELVAGSTLYLPISVDEALLSVGDGHAAQGDGEVGGTAIECPMQRVELTLDLRDDLQIDAPVASTPAGWLTMGLGADLDEATEQALEGMVALLRGRHGVSRADAFALASVVVSVRVTQLVNEVVGVHALLPAGALR